MLEANSYNDLSYTDRLLLTTYLNELNIVLNSLNGQQQNEVLNNFISIKNNFVGLLRERNINYTTLPEDKLKDSFAKYIKKVASTTSKKFKKSKKRLTGHFVGFGLVTTIFAAVSSIVFGIYGIGKGANASQYYNSKVSALTLTDYDYRVYNVLPTQVEEMRKQESIDSVFEYYRYEGKAKLYDRSVDTIITFSPNVEDLDITAYNDSRLIAGDMNLNEDSIFIDSKVADKIGAKLGSSLKIEVKDSVLDLKVAGVFFDNTMYTKSSVYFHLTDALKAKLNLKENGVYSGVMIKANDKTACYDYIKDFKPTGLMWNRDRFGTDKEYEDYVKKFMETDYSSSIYDKGKTLKQALDSDANNKILNDSEKLVKIGAIIFASCTLVLIIKSIIGISVNKRFKLETKANVTKNKKKFALSYLIIDIVGLIVSLGVLAIMVSVELSSNIVIASFPQMAWTFAMGACVVGHVVVLLLDQLITAIAIKN